MTKSRRSGFLNMVNLFLYYYRAEAEQNDYAAIKHTVEPVEHAAVSGKQIAHILYAALALYRALEEIAYLAHNGRTQTY